MRVSTEYRNEEAVRDKRKAVAAKDAEVGWRTNL